MTQPTAPHPDPNTAGQERSEASARLSLSLHAIAYALVNTINVIADAANGGGWSAHHTFLWWGIGLAAHAAVVLWPGLRSR